MTAISERLRLEAVPLRGIYREVADERLRASIKHESGSIEIAPYDSAQWWTVVMEEIGEVARAFQEQSRVEIREELIQCAAMLTAWVEACGRGLESARR